MAISTAQSTYTIADALNIANRTMPRAIEDANAAVIATAAISHIWKRYDWRETMNELPPFWLLPNRQDYGPPFYAVPQDFYGLREAYLVQTTSTPVTRWELFILRNPRKEYVQGLQNAIGYVPETRSFRVYPMPPANIGATNFLIDGTYKMRPPLITAAALQTTLVPWNDMYIMEFVTALRWAAAKLAGSSQATQQMEELDLLIDQMAGAEGLELGDQPIYPAESIYGQGDANYGVPGLGVVGLI